MKIHFVCRGNTYRSRMAEAYLRSKGIERVEVSSSGTHASANENGPISWVSAWVLKKNSLTDHVSTTWTQTTKDVLDNVDLIIFMEEDHHLYSLEHFDFQKNNFQIWDIKDIESNTDDKDKMKIGMKTFLQIQKKIDELIAKEL